MTSKQRAYLKSLANTINPIFQVGKSSLTPEFIKCNVSPIIYSVIRQKLFIIIKRKTIHSHGITLSDT